MLWKLSWSETQDYVQDERVVESLERFGMSLENPMAILLVERSEYMSCMKKCHMYLYTLEAAPEMIWDGLTGS